MAVVAVVPVPKRVVKKKMVKPSRPTRCALIVAPGISPTVAKNFAQQYFNRPVSIFYIAEKCPLTYEVIGTTKPRADNASQIKAQQIYILPKSAHATWRYGGSRVELVNTINLFRQVRLKKGQKPRDVIMVHGFAPKEIPRILKKGLDHFPA